MKKSFKLGISFVLFIVGLCVIFVHGNAAPSKYFDSTYYTNNIPSGYYNDVDTSLTEDNFRRNLSTVISRGYVKHSYSANNEVLKYTDPDPKGNGNIICLYTGQSLAYGSWNKEHVWAKSHGFGTESWDPYSDAHHLRPTLNSINSSRSNSDFGEVSGGSSDPYGNKWTSSTFEPRDEVKGDVARMMFYMATRYGYESPYNLKLVNDSNTSMSKEGNGRFGNLQTLLKWHYQDPVSNEEIYRNNIIYTFYQKNRNPYIDHPEYVDLAYPNSYSSSTEVDEAKVNNVISLIGSLPTTVSLDHKAQITAAQTAYNALNNLEKQQVVNYAELQRCLTELAALEGSNPSDPVNPDVPTTQGDIIIDFTSVSGVGGSYTSNASITASGKSFTASSAGTWDNALRIGSKTPTSLSKFGLSDSGHFLEPKFDVENLKSMKLTVSKTFSGITDWYVFFTSDGNNYRKVNEGAISSTSGFEITASLSTPLSGRFVLVIVGKQPRMDITGMSLYTGTGGSGDPITPVVNFTDSFVKENTSSSIKLDYNQTTGEVLEVGLRFGAKIQASSYNSGAKYGVIVFDEEYAELFTAGEQINETSVSHFVGDEFFIEITPVRVDSTGKADSNGEYYQFAWVINNMEGHYTDCLVAVIYVEYNGKLYLANKVSTSLSDVAKEYVDQNIFDDPIINQALQSLYE